MSPVAELRVSLGADSVSIWSPRILGGNDSARVRAFLASAFSVEEIENIELVRSKSFGRIKYAPSANPRPIWSKLARVLKTARPDARTDIEKSVAAPTQIDARFVYLDGATSAAVRVTRIGNVLSTWRLRSKGKGTLDLWHPALRNRSDVAFRLEEVLVGLFGVASFRISIVTATLSIRFDAGATNTARIVRELEKAWPKLLKGSEGPPSRKRLLAAAGLVGLAYTGQYVAPAVRPFAVAGMTLYSLPNAVNALKDLRRGRIGLPALYTTGVTFMLITGFPFTASVMASLMQLWPQLTFRKLARTQRRVFAAQRRRPTSATRAQGDRAEAEVEVDELRAGDIVVLRKGDVVPVDGVVEEGFAALRDEVTFGGAQLEDKAPGDVVSAGSMVYDGTLRVRVERAGAETSASYIDAWLPRGTFTGLPSSDRAEAIANRNAKAALALAGLALTRFPTLQPAQATIRPDYASAPRLAAQLSALQGIANAWQRGVLFRNPAAIDRIGEVDVFVIDETSGAAQRQLEVEIVRTSNGTSPELVTGYAAAVQTELGRELGRALLGFASKLKVSDPGPVSVQRHAGMTSYRDRDGALIQVATSDYLRASQIEVPHRLRPALTQPPDSARRPAAATVRAPAAPRALWVLRDGEVIGVISFVQSGALLGREIVEALRARHEKPRLVYLSSAGKREVSTLARALDIETFHAKVSPLTKREIILGLGRRVLWVGDGSQPDARESIEASPISVSVAPSFRARDDRADVQLLRGGLLGLPEAIDEGRAHTARLQRDYRVVYTVNLAGVAGGWLLNFTALRSGLLSNFGTALVYARYARDLERLSAQAEARQVRLTAKV